MSAAGEDYQRLLEPWFTGWAALRSYRTARERGALAALRSDRSGDWEYFVSDPTQEAFAGLAELANASAERAVTVFGPHVHDYVALARAHGMGLLSAAEQFMRVDMGVLDQEAAFLAEPGLSLRVLPLGGRRTASVCEARLGAALLLGEVVVASGTVAACGEYAVYDQITTHPEYRRRGYGRVLMQALTSAVTVYPVTTGLLLASTDGQRLYRKLGWHSVAAVTVLVPRAQFSAVP